VRVCVSRAILYQTRGYEQGCGIYLTSFALQTIWQTRASVSTMQKLFQWVSNTDQKTVLG